MAPRNPAYGRAHDLRRAALIVPGAVCHLCGAPASELDHVPPLALHDHREGSGCCRSLPACGPCQREQGWTLGGRGFRPALAQPPAPVVVEVEPSPGPGDPSWNACPWLKQLRRVPKGATWPRYMTGPHPEAVDSLGPVAVAWLEEHAELPLRWWQKLVLYRQLEVDASGWLVWLDALVTTARQVGKSTGLRGGATWRLHAADVFGEPQTILHTGKDLPVCKEVQRPARVWAKERGYPVREQNGNEQITEPRSGSRWIVRGKGSVYGYSGSYAMVDEAWGVPADVVDDGVTPTMMERTSPQLVLASTAHGRATSLFPTRRTVALDELTEPVSTLLIEWSAPRSTPIDDRDAWRNASPHWSRGRERLLESKLAQVSAGRSLDPDEADPVESFRAQYLNIWPVRTSSGPGATLIAPDVWALFAGPVDAGAGPIVVAVEDNFGRGCAVAVATAIEGTDRFELGGWLVDGWEEAAADLASLAASRQTSVIVGASLAGSIDPTYAATVATAAETRSGLALVRALVAAGRVAHDQAPDLAQLTTVRVKEPPSGLTTVPGYRADLARAAAWALQAAHARPNEPAIW